MVHVVPEQEKSGKRMRPPLMTLPCVLDEAVSVISTIRIANSALRPTCNERNTHRIRRALEQGHINRVLSAERPVRLSDRKRRLLEPLVQIRRNVHLDSEFFRVHVRSVGVICLWIRARNQHAPVREECRLRVIQPCNDRVVEDRETLTDGLRRVVKDGIVIGVAGLFESSHALVGTVQDHVRPVSSWGEPRTPYAREPTLAYPSGSVTMHGITLFDGYTKSSIPVRKFRSSIPLIHIPFSPASMLDSQPQVQW